MKFIKEIENRNIITEALSELDFMPVQEGWGIRISTGGLIVGGILVATAITFPFFNAWARFLAGMGISGVFSGINKLQDKLTRDKVEKIMKSKEITDYLELACDAAIKDLKSHYKGSNVTINPLASGHAFDDEVSLEDEMAEDGLLPEDVPEYYKNPWKTDKKIDMDFDFITVRLKVEKYELYCYADTTHIESVIMTYGLKFKASNGKTYEVARKYKLLSPTDENLKKLGYRQETK